MKTLKVLFGETVFHTKTVAGIFRSMTVAVVLALAFLFAPMTQAAPWLTNGPLYMERYAHTSTLLPNGQVLIAGGVASNSLPTKTAEVYDPTTSASRRVGDMTIERQNQTATLLPNGKVLVVGGVNDGSGVAQCRII